MIAGVLLLASLSWAGDTARPSPPVPVPGECRQSFPVRMGDPLSAELVRGECVARCGGVLMPTSDTARLLQVEANEKLHLADIELLKADRESLRIKVNRANRPWVHRFIGGAVGVTIGASLVAAYYNGNRSSQ
jgi:hypothetical protein